MSSDHGPYLIDTHTHLADEVFDLDRLDVIARAKQAGVRQMVVVSETLADCEKTLRVCREHNGLLPALGLFPTHLDMEQAHQICELARQHADELIAIGEVGLDYWKVQEDADREVQRDILRLFVALARELDLTLNVHSRSAGHHTVQLLREEKAHRVHMHAYDGSIKKLRPAIEAGYFFSIPASVSHSRQKEKLVDFLSVDQLLLETDSPVLGPERDKRNEPCNVMVALEKISEIKQIPRQTLIEQLFSNTSRAYPSIQQAGTL